MPELIKILLVDDEPDILEFLGYNLSREGFHVFRAPGGKEAIEIARRELPHLVLLDVMMPDMDGMEVCRELRQSGELKNVLIAFLTARNEDYSHIAGFDAGADDYINKPIKPRVLIGRIKALLRRHQPSSVQVTEKTDFKGLTIDPEKYIVICEGEEINLPRKEFQILHLLSSRPGKVFTRNEILDKIWNADIVVGDRTVDVHIRKLREKIGERYLRTVKGVGYKFEF